MKLWLSPWVLPLVMLGVVLVLSRPLIGIIWIVVSVIVVRLLNGQFERLTNDEPLRHPYETYLGAVKSPYVRTPS